MGPDVVGCSECTEASKTCEPHHPMRTPLLLTLALLLAGCARVCEKGARLGEEFQKRHSACYASGTLPSPLFDAQRCEGSMQACSAADEEVLNRYFDCIGELPVCSEENRAVFNEAFLGCASKMGQLSQGCFRP